MQNILYYLLVRLGAHKLLGLASIFLVVRMVYLMQKISLQTSKDHINRGIIRNLSEKTIQIYRLHFKVLLRSVADDDFMAIDFFHSKRFSG